MKPYFSQYSMTSDGKMTKVSGRDETGKRPQKSSRDGMRQPILLCKIYLENWDKKQFYACLQIDRCIHS